MDTRSSSKVFILPAPHTTKNPPVSGRYVCHQDLNLVAKEGIELFWDGKIWTHLYGKVADTQVQFWISIKDISIFKSRGMDCKDFKTSAPHIKERKEFIFDRIGLYNDARKGAYLIRTSDGLYKALEDKFKLTFNTHSFPIAECMPEKYPCVVSLIYDEYGRHFINFVYFS